jgi:hypothetical protein
MPDPVDPKTLLTLVEMSIDSMYELEAIGELLEQKGMITKDEIITLAKELKHKTPPTESPPFPHPTHHNNPSPLRRMRSLKRSWP